MEQSSDIAPRILTATDFSAESELAFFHALAYSVNSEARLTVIHIGPESRDDVPWEQFPSIRDTLIKWGKLEEGAEKQDVGKKLGMAIRKMAMRDEDPRNGLSDYLRKRPTDLLVMTTSPRRGLARLTQPSVAEAVARRSHCPTLLLTTECPPLIDPETGRRTLRKALVIYDHEPDPRPAFHWINRWFLTLAEDVVDVLALYVGESADEPDIVLPKNGPLNWSRRTENGEPLDVILETAKLIDADLIALAPGPHQGLIERLRGTLNEQVLRESNLPLLLLS